MLHTVLMVGGAGTRFWPLSRKKTPKYMLPIAGDRSMLLQTVERIEPMVPADRVLCITSQEQATGIRRALKDVPNANVVGEPMGRDSAAAVALGAVMVHQRDPDGVILCMPGDSLIRQSGKFRKSVKAAVKAAEKGSLVTFGIQPPTPETRFGYIHRGRRLAAIKGGKVFEVRRFTEKPDAKTAQKMVASGEYYWNSGNFVWRADVILDQFRRHAPALHEAMEAIRPALGTRRQASAIRREYEKLEKISVDYAVMEPASAAGLVAVVEAEFDWDDVGSWTALERHYPQDDGGNTAIGRTLLLESRGCIVYTDDKHIIATVGLDDVIVVHTRDATLVCPKGWANDVKSLVKEFEKREMDELL
jgi:mannose-1-phosphate guanylyltransferase